MRIHSWLIKAVLVGSLGIVATAQVNSNSTVTGPKGKTGERTATRSKGSVQATDTGSGGKSVTRDTTHSAAGAQGTVTGPKGKTATRSVARSKGSATATDTGPNGKTVTRNRTTSIDKR